MVKARGYQSGILNMPSLRVPYSDINEFARAMRFKEGLDYQKEDPDDGYKKKQPLMRRGDYSLEGRAGSNSYSQQELYKRAVRNHFERKDYKLDYN